MLPSLARATSTSTGAVAALLCCAAGCTLFAGQPWGQADVSLEVTFAPEEARLTPEGWLKTSLDYALDVEELLATVDAVTLSVSEDEVELSFDPASPPPGYSLCHGGHCHADDGSLVDYEDVERSLTNSGGGGGSVLALPVVGGPVALAREPVSVAVEPCEEGCVLERGRLTDVAVAMSALTLRARVYDLRPPEDARLPAGGVSLVTRMEGSLLASTDVDVAVDGSEPPGLALSALLSVSPGLFDGVDFGALPRDDDDVLLLDDEARAAVAENLSESELSLDVTRFLLEQDLTPLFLPLAGADGETT